ncbi:isochorismatase family protein [Nocardia vaccinii]|uniref:isochorismatase family protein n=1 Tax=Nocardia vaccinii TaxID=1822 RepID=UPI001C3F88C0|nr:isochorismatase family protein [Nocardia vaccinii]
MLGRDRTARTHTTGRAVNMSTTFDEGFGETLTPGPRPVVLAIDMMRAYFDPDSPLYLPSDSCLTSAATVLATARAHRVPIIHTRVAYRADGSDGGLFVRKIPALRHLFGDGPLGRLMPEVAPRDGEPVLVKQFASAFFGTEMDRILSDLDADTVVIVGVSTSGCVRATAVDAIQHGYLPVVVSDAVADRTPETQAGNLFDLAAKYAQVIDERAVCTYLEEFHDAIH